MADGCPDLDNHNTRPPHVAEFNIKAGGFSATSRLSITTSGVLAVATLVGVILSGTAGIVWTATGPARRRAKAPPSAPQS